MENYVLYEIIGYVASVLVAVSLMMSAIIKLRIVNMIGAFTFSVYGVLIGSIPVAAMNGFIVLINIYFLIKLWRDKEYFKLLNVDKESKYLEAFLHFHKDDILNYQPGFDFKQDYNFSLFVLRDMVPAGLILGNRDDKGMLKIDLDFVIPNFRDFKIGEYLFGEKIDYFIEQGIREILAASGNPDHNRYLEKAGFKQVQSDSYSYELKL
ncbi:MAG: YgjV family protein [Balneolaceae bacterium]|nr:YgjV family protein [Balneolaceae bacterium]